jgi:hypothetical protein
MLRFLEMFLLEHYEDLTDREKNRFFIIYEHLLNEEFPDAED